MPSPPFVGTAALSGFAALRRSIRRPAACAGFATLAFCPLASGAMLGAQSLAISGFSPTGAAPGESVTLTGSGFSSDPEDHLAFVLGAWGSGSLLEPASSSPGSMQVLLGPSASRFAGPICLWRGRNHVLPGTLVAGESGTWLVHHAEFFVPSEAVTTLKPFLVEGPTPQTHDATTEDDEVVFRIVPDSGLLGPLKIDLAVMIDGGTCGPGGKPGSLAPFHGGLALPARAFHLRLENIDPLGPPDAGALARDLALVLRSTFGALGLSAKADESALHISWPRLSQVENAVGVLRIDP
jgi:hypothetical protein